MLCLVSQSCPILCDLPGFSVRGVLQPKILEWVVMSSSRESSQPRDQTQVSHIADSLPSEPLVKPKDTGVGGLSLLRGDTPDPGIESGSPALQADSLTAELLGSSFVYVRSIIRWIISLVDSICT